MSVLILSNLKRQHTDLQNAKICYHTFRHELFYIMNCREQFKSKNELEIIAGDGECLVQAKLALKRKPE